MPAWLRNLLGGALTALLLTACSAALPPAKTVEPIDLDRLGGEWKGTWSEGSWSGAITLTINPQDGMGEFVFEMPTGPEKRTSRIIFSEGKLILEGDAGETALTLHEQDNRRALVGEYRHDITGQTGKIEVWRP
ncbi:MAG TPA: hypothetical protein VMT79_18615 [Candidatus Binatia bacterium]|nr:hypothetical protein [Candidatus Binatia bacterium]